MASMTRGGQVVWRLATRNTVCRPASTINPKNPPGGGGQKMKAEGRETGRGSQIFTRLSFPCEGKE